MQVFTGLSTVQILEVAAMEQRLEVLTRLIADVKVTENSPQGQLYQVIRDLLTAAQKALSLLRASNSQSESHSKVAFSVLKAAYTGLEDAFQAFKTQLN